MLLQDLTLKMVAHTDRVGGWREQGTKTIQNVPVSYPGKELQLPTVFLHVVSCHSSQPQLTLASMKEVPPRAGWAISNDSRPL